MPSFAYFRRQLTATSALNPRKLRNVVRMEKLDLPEFFLEDSTSVFSVEYTSDAPDGGAVNRTLGVLIDPRAFPSLMGPSGG